MDIFFYGFCLGVVWMLCNASEFRYKKAPSAQFNCDLYGCQVKNKLRKMRRATKNSKKLKFTKRPNTLGSKQGRSQKFFEWGFSNFLYAKI